MAEPPLRLQIQNLKCIGAIEGKGTNKYFLNNALKSSVSSNESRQMLSCQEALGVCTAAHTREGMQLWNAVSRDRA